MYSPLLLNPANTGNFYGDLRAHLNYRNQWSATGSPFNTTVIGVDKQIKPFNQKFGVGGYFVSDLTEGIAQNKLYASVSYGFNLNENYFALGIQAGAVFNSLATESWEIFNPETGKFDYPNGEPTNNTMYADFNAGILWQRKINIFEPEMGVSASHINSPKRSFLNSAEERVSISTTLHGGLKTNLSDELYVLPSFLFANQNNNFLTMVGANVGYRLLGNRSSVKELFGGLHYRNGLINEPSDFSLLLGTTVGRFDFALSYDLNLTGLSSSQNASSFEISIIYKSISTVLNSYSIPCERF